MLTPSIVGHKSTKVATAISLRPVEISGALYAYCSEAARTMACGQKRTSYGKGCANSGDDPFKVQRTGLLGEVAASLLLGLKADLSYKPKGDKCDFLIRGYSLDVKCSTHNYGKNLIVYRETENGRPHSLKHIYVASYLLEDFPQHWFAKVKVLGYNLGREIEKSGVTPSSKGVHLNYALSHGQLRSLERLKDFIDGKINFDSL